MDPSAFDRLVRAFSRSASRRRTLGGLLGGALAVVAGSSDAKQRHSHDGLGQRLDHAHGKANRRKRGHGHGQSHATAGRHDCGAWFAAVFGPNGLAVLHCLSDAARGQGLCAQCGTATPPDQVCCKRLGRVCASYAGATCCAGSDTCGGGGTPNVCGCAPTTCAKQGKNCGQIDDGCGNTLSCGNCTPGSTTPLCVHNVCSACSASTPCPAGCCAGDGRCRSGTADDACGTVGGACVACGAGERCIERQCVCAPKCAGKVCGADDECGGTCPCPDANPICHHNTADTLVCCCSNVTPNPQCIANESDPSRICCCATVTGGQQPYCRIGESGETCCCTDPNQSCTAEGCV